MNNKRKRITLKYHIILDVIKVAIVLCGAIIGSLILYKNISPLADDNWRNIYFGLSMLIVIGIGLFFSLIVITTRKRKKWILILGPDGDLQSEDIYSKIRKNVNSYKLKQSVTQQIFGLCNLTLYDSEGRRIIKMKNVSINIKKYL